MKLVMTRLKVYAKLCLYVVVAVVLAMVVFKNRGNRVDVWFIREYQSVNVLLLMVCTAAATLLCWWVLSTTRQMWRDMKSLQQAAAMQKQQQEQRDMERRLSDTERRIDAKLKNAVSKEDDAGVNRPHAGHDEEGTGL